MVATLLWLGVLAMLMASVVRASDGVATPSDIARRHKAGTAWVGSRWRMRVETSFSERAKSGEMVPTSSAETVHVQDRDRFDHTFTLQHLSQIPDLAVGVNPKAGELTVERIITRDEVDAKSLRYSLDARGKVRGGLFSPPNIPSERLWYLKPLAGWYNNMGIGVPTHVYSHDDAPLADVLAEASEMKLRPEPEAVGGKACTVLEVLSRRGKYVIWFAPDLAWMPMRVVVDKGPGDRVGNAVMEPSGALSLHWEVTVAAVGRLDGVFYPREFDIEYEIEVTDNKPPRHARIHSTVVEFSMDPDLQSLGAFRPSDVPAGSLFHDVSKPDDVPFRWRSDGTLAVGDEGEEKRSAKL